MVSIIKKQILIITFCALNVAPAATAIDNVNSWWNSKTQLVTGAALGVVGITTTGYCGYKIYKIIQQIHALNKIANQTPEQQAKLKKLKTKLALYVTGGIAGIASCCGGIYLGIKGWNNIAISPDQKPNLSANKFHFFYSREYNRESHHMEVTNLTLTVDDHDQYCIRYPGICTDESDEQKNKIKEVLRAQLKRYFSNVTEHQLEKCFEAYHDGVMQPILNDHNAY